MDLSAISCSRYKDKVWIMMEAHGGWSNRVKMFMLVKKHNKKLEAAAFPSLLQSIED